LFEDYQVGSEDGWSAIYKFTTLKTGNSWSPKFAVYGDLGNINGKTLGRLTDEVQICFYDAILHVGMSFNPISRNYFLGFIFMCR
jgi:hypothetical protein